MLWHIVLTLRFLAYFEEQEYYRLDATLPPDLINLSISDCESLKVATEDVFKTINKIVPVIQSNSNEETSEETNLPTKAQSDDDAILPFERSQDGKQQQFCGTFLMSIFLQIWTFRIFQGRQNFNDEVVSVSQAMLKALIVRDLVV